MAYSKEFRREVLSACDANAGTRAVALKFNVSESWVRRVKQERREQGKLGPATNTEVGRRSRPDSSRDRRTARSDVGGAADGIEHGVEPDDAVPCAATTAADAQKKF